MALRDLDAQLVRIRDHRSRVYYSEALRAYRSGAYRAAISAAWVALVFDILLKYRELSALGDAEATSFISDWDNAITSNDVAKLLEYERSLLEHAKSKMGLFNHQEHRMLQRLYEDRHLCAHPAFASDDRLFEPTDELVRTHIAGIVEIVLCQRPVQGRKIFEAFSADIQSPGFPRDEEKAILFVESKYLAGMRTEIVKNFGIVLAKSMIRNVPSEWEGYRIPVVDSLNAVRLRRSESWEDILTAVAKMVNDDEPEHRIRCLALLADFPEAYERLEQATIDALREVATSDESLVDYPEAFAAVSLPAFKSSLIDRFEQLKNGKAGDVLEAAADMSFCANSIERFADSGSFRSAEANFDTFVRPFAKRLPISGLDRVFEAVEENGQIWNAGGTPDRLMELLKVSNPKTPSVAAIDSLYLSMRPRVRNRFSDIWKFLKQVGWTEPEEPVDEED